MSNEMKLYHSAASPNSRRVRIFLAEKGIAIPLVAVDLAKGEQHSDAYRAINPRRVVPTLVLADGTAIGEVLAIWRYLEEVYPTPPILGSTPKDKALVTMWERRAELEGFAAVMEGVRNAAERLKGRAIAGPHDYDQIPALAERSKLRVKNFYADLDARLAEVSFVAGNTFSAADITALVTVDFAAKAMSFSAPGEHAALARWHENVSSRPSVGALAGPARTWPINAMTEKPSATTPQKCRCAQHDNRRIEQGIGPRSVRYAFQQAGLQRGRAVLVIELHSTQRAHRAWARRPVQSG